MLTYFRHHETNAVDPMKTEETAVYVIDDDHELCESVEWLLESAAISSIVCHSADEFLAQFNPHRPACLILDVRMPQMSGTRLQEKLNELAPHVSIIFVSAHGDIDMSVSTIKAGAQDFLEKPYDPQRLIDAVQVGMDRAVGRFKAYTKATALQNKIQQLTPREYDVFKLVIEGLPSQNIGRKLGMTVKTVDVHRTRIRAKTDADSIGTLVRDILRYDVQVD